MCRKGKGIWGRLTNKKAPTGRGFDATQVIGLRRGHIDGALIHRTLDAKGDLSVHECIQSVVLADADIDARMELGATLAHDDAACVDHFAAKLLDAEHLGCESRPFRVEPPPFFCAIFGYS